MFAAAGTLYVYPIHSRYCMNVVTEEEGRGAAVLIRGVEPECGTASMWNNRHTSVAPLTMVRRDLQTLTQGPGRLCEAFQVDRELDGAFLPEGHQIWIEQETHAVNARKFTIRQDNSHRYLFRPGPTSTILR